MTSAADTPLIIWGRCRTGRRWFWTAHEIGTDHRLEGKTDTRDEAARQGHLAALQLAGGVYAHIDVVHSTASSRLRAINAAQRKTRPHSDSTPTGHRMPPQIPKRPANSSLKELKRLMADSHPDRGGSSEDFIKARAAYQRARIRVAATR